MELLKSLYIKSYIFLKSFGSSSRDHFIASLNKVKKGLEQETEETKEMLEIYYRFSLNKASKEEMETANKQFRDLLRGMGLGFLAVMPFAPVTIPFLVKVGRKLGIEILPSAFNSKKAP